jgi:pantoate--beta-alanine ligase
MMKVFHTISETVFFVTNLKQQGKTIGFVPTMGSLHKGHLTLVAKARAENDIIICSIFVNPIQFNNPEDLAKYPRTPEADLTLLNEAGCDIVFVPSEKEMYPEPDSTVYDFGKLDKVMEGRFRPGHFNGVAIVVRRLFEIALPDTAYFGEKDFQQVAIIKKMVQMFDLPVQIVPCPIIRESDGLAMSSRNQRLLPEERAIAPVIYSSLQKAAGSYSFFTPEGLKMMLYEDIEENPLIRVEYIEIVDMDSLLPVKNWDESKHVIVCVAVFLGQVRLIDNIILYG